MQRTIAIVGATNAEGTRLVTKLAEAGNRLLLLGAGFEEMQALTERINQRFPAADTEALACTKDGCWEADIIILGNEALNDDTAAANIKDVATRKIVALCSSNDNVIIQHGLLYPNSRLLSVSLDENNNDVMIAGEDEEALREISEMLCGAGYSVAVENFN